MPSSETKISQAKEAQFWEAEERLERSLVGREVTSWHRGLCPRSDLFSFCSLQLTAATP